MSIKVQVLMGLPGSGKTYYAEKTKWDNIIKEDGDTEDINVIHFDDKYFHRWFTSYCQDLILDGLFLTNKDIIKVLKELKNKSSKSQDFNIEIIYWKEDRDSCLWNDKSRRIENSETTIKTAVYEYPDIALIKKETGYDVTVIEKEVVRKPKYFNNISSKNQKNIRGNYLISNSWVTGGSARSYDGSWNSVYDSIDAENVPDFKELTNILYEVCPNLSYLEFNKIFKDFVKVRHFSESDYYSETENAQYICNLDELFEYLSSRGYFQEVEVFKTEKTEYVIGLPNKKSDNYFEVLRTDNYENAKDALKIYKESNPEATFKLYREIINISRIEL